MKTLHSFAELACACCGNIDDVINAEVAKFGAVPLTKFAVHFTVATTLEVVTKQISAPSPDAARKIVAEAYKPSSIIVRKIKRTA